MAKEKTTHQGSGSVNGPRHARGLRLLSWVDRAIINAVTAMLVVSGVCVVIISTIGAIDSVGRAFFNKPVVGAVEISEALLAVTIFSALAFAQKQGGHVVVDILSSHYGPRFRHFFRLVTYILTLAALGFLLWRMQITAYQGWLNNEVSAGLVPVPIWLAKAFAVLGLVVACLECLREMIWEIFCPVGQAEFVEHVDSKDTTLGH